jgi:tripartite-type tricarboxylate transporter receptor subunit TctC
MDLANDQRMKLAPGMTPPSMLRRRLVQVAGVSLCPAMSVAFAQAPWPARPVKLVIPFPAGGATDYAARAIGDALAEKWPQPLVFDNRAGAGSTIGTEAGARSAPDGYTLVMGIPAGVTIAPHIYPKLGYHPLTDLVPIAGFATSPLVVVVPADSPYKSLRDLVAAARAEPGKLSFASNGSGSLPHLTAEWFFSEAKVRVTHVPYKGSAQALPDLVAGRITMMFDIIVSALPLIEGGRLRALAVTGAQPTTRLPGVPTVASLGYPGFASDQWYGLFAPAGTPAAIVSRLESEVRAATESTSLRGRMWQRGAEIRYSSAVALGEMVKKDSARWAVVAKATGARAE